MTDLVKAIMHKGVTVHYENFQVEEKSFTVAIKGRFEVDAEIIKIPENELTQEQYEYFGRQFLQKLRNSVKEKYDARFTERR